MRRHRDGVVAIATIHEQLGVQAQARTEEHRTGGASAPGRAPRAEDPPLREVQDQPSLHLVKRHRAAQPVRQLLEDEAVPGADTDVA